MELLDSPGYQLDTEDMSTDQEIPIPTVFRQVWLGHLSSGYLGNVKLLSAILNGLEKTNLV